MSDKHIEELKWAIDQDVIYFQFWEHSSKVLIMLDWIWNCESERAALPALARSADIENEQWGKSAKIDDMTEYCDSIWEL